MAISDSTEHPYCSKCGRRIRPDLTSGICRACASVCECGKKKDHRSNECRSCGMQRKALKQWNEMRPQMLTAVRAAMRVYRITFDDISLESRWEIKPDGRRYRYYWEGDRQRCVYRYQWIWIKANGPIPKGFEIHHKNHNCSDDRLDNLELLSGESHAKYHGQIASKNAPNYECATCHIIFKGPAKPGRAIRYCSQKCWYNKMPMKKCEHCKTEFKPKATGQRFCSKPCWNEFAKNIQWYKHIRQNRIAPPLPEAGRVIVTSLDPRSVTLFSCGNTVKSVTQTLSCVNRDFLYPLFIQQLIPLNRIRGPPSFPKDGLSKPFRGSVSACRPSKTYVRKQAQYK